MTSKKGTDPARTRDEIRTAEKLGTELTVVVTLITKSSFVSSVPIWEPTGIPVG